MVLEWEMRMVLKQEQKMVLEQKKKIVLEQKIVEQTRKNKRVSKVLGQKMYAVLEMNVLLLQWKEVYNW